MSWRTLSVADHSTETEPNQMAKRTILVSDLTGKEIGDKTAAKVTINFSDARKGTIVLDVNENEITDLISKGIRQARRGRRPKPPTA